MTARGTLAAARGVTGDRSLDAAARAVVDWPFRSTVHWLGLASLVGAVWLGFWYLWGAVVADLLVRLVLDRDVIVARGERGAVAIVKRTFSQSVGPDFLQLDPDSVEHRSGRRWRVDEHDVIAGGDAAAILAQIAAPGHASSREEPERRERRRRP